MPLASCDSDTKACSTRLSMTCKADEGFFSNTLLHLVSPLRAIQCLSGPYCHSLLPLLVSIQVPLLEVLLLACYWSAHGFLTFGFPCLCCLFLCFFPHVWLLLVLASVKLSHSFKKKLIYNLFVFSCSSYDSSDSSSCLCLHSFVVLIGTKNNRIFKAM